MTRAKYSILYCKDGIVWLVDLAEQFGTMSVTNDAEAVVEEVNRLFPGHRIVYRDTVDNWDELCHNDGIFTEFKIYQTENRN